MSAISFEAVVAAYLVVFAAIMGALEYARRRTRRDGEVES